MTFALSSGMQKTTWMAPAFEEINLGSEIGTYYEDDDPSFLLGRKTYPRRTSAHELRARPGRSPERDQP